MPGALDDILVIDLTQGSAGAIAAMFLCDHGARVIRVELPDTESERDHPTYILWDRGKESIELDIASNSAAFEALISHADVLIESFEPSSDLQQIVDYDRLHQINPRLVSCSITAYGKQGPLKNESAIEDLVNARMGVLAAQPGFREGPVHVVHPTTAAGAATLAAQGIVAALYAREKNGLGRTVETSLMAGSLVSAPKLVGEKIPQRPSQMTTQGGGPFYSVFECGDGEWVQLGCIHSGFVDIAAAVMDLTLIVSEPRFGDGRYPADLSVRQELFNIVADMMKTKSSAEWEEIFEASDVPHARACYAEEALDHPQVIFNKLVFETDDPVVGHVTEMGIPIRMTGTPGVVKGPRHLRGHDSNRVLAEFANTKPAASGPDNANPRTFDPPLKGVKVMEMTNVIAGPTAGKHLADLGADVVKFESPFGDISRPGVSPFFLFLNSNKRSVSIDTHTPEGQDVAQKIAASSDIMLANMRPGATFRMGLGDDWLAENNPNLIQTHLTAFGWEGPYSHRPGVDPLAQAWMGLQRSQGGPENPPVYLSALAPTDFTAGAMGTLGAVLALYAREHTGQSQNVYMNLLAAGALLDLEGFMKYEGKPPRKLADKGHHGLSALHRLYRTSDDWIYLIAEGDSQFEALCRATGNQDLPSDSRYASDNLREVNDVALAEAFEKTFDRQSTDHWLETLKSAGVPCSPARSVTGDIFFADEQITANDLVFDCNHPNLGAMKYAAGGIKFGNTDAINSCCTPLLGQSTRVVLEEMGYSTEQIDELYAKEVALTERPSED